MSIKISDPTLQQLFGTVVRYTIPPYQRRYRWKQDSQWQPLWDDIRDLADDWQTNPGQLSDDPYFLGALVLRPLPHPATEPENREVIDGQQRLTTLQILLDAAQAVFQTHSRDHAALLVNLILNDENFTKADGDYRYKVWPSRHDRDAFRAVMDDRASTDSWEDSLIVQSHAFFYKEIEEWLQQAADAEERKTQCDALLSVLTQHLQFVVINVSGERIANTIFETLNARGTPLQAWDLVKNYMYEKAGRTPDFEDWFDDEQLKFDEEWWQTENGAGRNRRSNVDLYLNHFLVLRTESEASSRTSNAVYRDFVRYVEKPDGAGEKAVKGVGNDFSRIGEVYRDIMQADHSAPHGLFLDRWRIEGHGVLTPVILWLWSSGVPGDQLELAVRALDSYFGRRLVCQSSSKDYRELSIGLLKELGVKGPGRAGSATLDYLIERARGVETLQWPSDMELRKVLTERQLYGKLTSARVQLILEAVERQLRIDAGVAETMPEQTLTIEHVMPQKWEAHWPPPLESGEEETPKQRRSRLIHSIGNLTLVTGKLNSKLKNAPWQEKREMLTVHSKMYLSNDLIAHESQWDEAAMIARSDRLADALIKVWPASDGI